MRDQMNDIYWVTDDTPSAKETSQPAQPETALRSIAGVALPGPRLPVLPARSRPPYTRTRMCPIPAPPDAPKIVSRRPPRHIQPRLRGCKCQNVNLHSSPQHVIATPRCRSRIP
jgi:hypothetical protein